MNRLSKTTNTQLSSLQITQQSGPHCTDTESIDRMEIFLFKVLMLISHIQVHVSTSIFVFLNLCIYCAQITNPHWTKDSFGPNGNIIR